MQKILLLRGVEANIKELATKVRDGKITIDEMTGGTFTITNGGVLGLCFLRQLSILLNLQSRECTTLSKDQLR